jgi:hypothetical protein
MAVRLRVPEVDDPDLVADVSYADGAEAVVKLRGSADKSSTEPLAKLFATVHDELCRRDARVVVVDLTEVDFMAAPCFRQLLAWVTRVQDMERARRYKLRLRGNKSLPWQTHSLTALSCFDTELVTVEG